MKTFIISCPDLTNEQKFQLQNELSLSYGRSAFIEVLPDTLLLRSDTNAESIHKYLEEYLTKKVDFIIYELAENLDFVHNIDSHAIDWTDVNF